MPPHLAYIEPFLGAGAVLRRKRPANRNIGIDRSKNALDLCTALSGSRTDIEYINGDALMILDSIGMLIQPSDTLVYCDPPYLAETRKGSDLYDHELTDPERHPRGLGRSDHVGAAHCASGGQGCADLFT